MANDGPYYINETEITLHRVVDDYYDAISIMSQYPECFQAYKSHIQKKRVASKEGGLTASNSQQEEGLLLERHQPRR